MEQFDWRFYISQYSDLQKANIDTYEKALQHWNSHGSNEERNILNHDSEKVSATKINFFQAIKVENETTVKLLHYKNTSLINEKYNGDSVLHYSTYLNQGTAITNFLLQVGKYDLYQKNNRGWSILTCAVLNRNKNAEILREILKVYDIDSNSIQDAIKLATENNSKEMIALLKTYSDIHAQISKLKGSLSMPTSLNNSPSTSDSGMKKTNSFRSGLNTPNTHTPNESPNISRRNSFAIEELSDQSNNSVSLNNSVSFNNMVTHLKRNELDQLRKMIDESDQDTLNKLDPEENSLLMLVIRSEHIALAKLLIKRGVRKDFKNKKGQTARDIALSKDSTFFLTSTL